MMLTRKKTMEARVPMIFVGKWGFGVAITMLRLRADIITIKTINHLFSELFHEVLETPVIHQGISKILHKTAMISARLSNIPHS
jgi:hypothetical protein